MNISQFMNLHKNVANSDENDGLRLGQRFMVHYIKDTWPELFYEKDDHRSEVMIREWLVAHHYFDQLPDPIYPFSEVENKYFLK